MGGRTQRLVVLLALAGASCTGATHGGIINNPFKATPATTPFVYDGHVRNMASWGDASAQTRPFTNTMQLSLECEGDNAAALATAAADTRQIVWFPALIGYGNDGYQLNDDAAACMMRLAAQIEPFRARTVAMKVVDEPPDVAWSNWPIVNGSAIYDPNRYNVDLGLAAEQIHSYGYTPFIIYGNIPDGLIIPSGFGIVGVESYDADWQAKLQRVETLTAAPIWLMSPGFIDGDPAVNDPILAQRVRDQWTWMQHDQRVRGEYFFLWCVVSSTDCNDLTTGNKSFYTVGGGSLPQTAQELVDLGTIIRLQ